MEKHIKTLAEWPLSRVDLVSSASKKYIRKTIHKDFEDEYHRQKYLYHNLRWTRVPQIYELEKEGDTVSFLMDWIDIDRPVKDYEAIELLADFRGEARGLHDKSFPIYDLNVFEEDVKVANQYGAKLIAHDYADIFQEEAVIVHGDFGTDHMVIDRSFELYLLDFGKSFFGPGTLDFAYFSRGDEQRENLAYELLGHKKAYFRLAKIVVAVQQIAWYHLCQTKYIPDHDYVNKEIKGEVTKILVA